jgi:hypothetical protein
MISSPKSDNILEKKKLGNLFSSEYLHQNTAVEVLVVLAAMLVLSFALL